MAAAQLNGRSSVLRCSLGMALAKMGKPAEAMVQLDAAIAADRSNPLARFEKAGVLLAGERFQEALSELGTLRVRVACYLPDQAHILRQSVNATYSMPCANVRIRGCAHTFMQQPFAMSASPFEGLVHRASCPACEPVHLQTRRWGLVYMDHQDWS